LCPARPYNIFPYYIIKSRTIEKIKLLNIKFVFWFPVHFDFLYVLICCTTFWFSVQHFDLLYNILIFCKTFCFSVHHFDFLYNILIWGTTFWFSVHFDLLYNIFSDTFHIIWRTEQDVIKNVNRSSCKVPVIVRF
jgi:hypothetical protein